MKYILTILILNLSNFIFSQQRIGADLSTRGINLNLTLHYQKVIKKNFIWSAGIFFGKYGRGENFSDTTLLKNGFRLDSPIQEINDPIKDSTGTDFFLINYKNKSAGAGIQIGLGYFYEISVVHGMRINLNAKFAYMQTSYSAYYYSVENGTYIASGKNINHPVGAISPELSHTIRLTGRFTFYYGLKFPYYYGIGKFQPRTSKDLLSGFEPELSIGLTYVMGKCD